MGSNSRIISNYGDGLCGDDPGTLAALHLPLCRYMGCNDSIQIAPVTSRAGISGFPQENLCLPNSSKQNPEIAKLASVTTPWMAGLQPDPF